MKNFNTNKKSNLALLQVDFEKTILALCEDAKTPLQALECLHRDLKSMEEASDQVIHLSQKETYCDLFSDFMINYDIMYYDDERDYLKKLYQETEEEAKAFDSDKVERIYRLMQYRGYIATCDKYGVRPFYEIMKVR